MTPSHVPAAEPELTPEEFRKGVFRAVAISKRYGGVSALNGVDFVVSAGEVHALLGANGAGKSTLSKILAGAEAPTEGQLLLDGKQVRFSSTRDAAKQGVAVVSQELNLFPDLTVLANLFLLREPGRLGLVSRTAMRSAARTAVAAVGLQGSLDRRLEVLSVGEQQLVEIARALLEQPRVIVFDEPNSALQRLETDRLLEVVKSLRDNGVGVVYVSHFLDDVFQVADRITVLRDGAVVMDGVDRGLTSTDAVVASMVGGLRPAPAVRHRSRQNPVPIGGELQVIDASVGRRLRNVSLSCAPGEILGLAGLEGSGAALVLEAIAGAVRLTHGRIVLPSGATGPRSLRAAARTGVAYIPRDRKGTGLMVDQTITENITQVDSVVLGRKGLFINRRNGRDRVKHWAGELQIKIGSAESLVNSLSGGNQQKVLLGKWLEIDPDVLLLNDVTRGVDIHTKAEIHDLVRSLADAGKTILLTSSDMDELITLSDRIVTFFKGHVATDIAADGIDERSLLAAISTEPVITT